MHAGLSDGRAARHQQDGGVVAVGVGCTIDGVGGADVHVNHHGLWASSDKVNTVGHRNSSVFVRDDNRFRDGPRDLGVCLSHRKRLDDGREIGTGIAEEILNAMRAKPSQ